MCENELGNFETSLGECLLRVWTNECSLVVFTIKVVACKSSKGHKNTSLEANLYSDYSISEWYIKLMITLKIVSLQNYNYVCTLLPRSLCMRFLMFFGCFLKIKNASKAEPERA